MSNEETSSVRRRSLAHSVAVMSCAASVALATLFTAGALVVPAARADGDPASDVLVATDVFYPYQFPLAKASRTALNRVVREAKHGGYPIRVALIPRRSDLGSIPELWLQPQPYAHFLAQELDFVYTGRLLIVMPNGYGMYWCVASRNYECKGDRTPQKERRALAGLRAQKTSGRDIAATAADAVRRLAAAHGTKLPA